jgi:hypothetical protein
MLELRRLGRSAVNMITSDGDPNVNTTTNDGGITST